MDHTAMSSYIHNVIRKPKGAPPQPTYAQVARAERYAEQLRTTTGADRRDRRRVARRARKLDRLLDPDYDGWKAGDLIPPAKPGPTGKPRLPFAIDSHNRESLMEHDRFEDWSCGCRHPLRGLLFNKDTHPTKACDSAQVVHFDAACRRCDLCIENRKRLWRTRAAITAELASRTWWGTLTYAPGKLKLAVVAENGERTWRDPLTIAEKLVACGYDIDKWLARVRAQDKNLVIKYVITVELTQRGEPHVHFLIHEMGPVQVTERTLRTKWWGGNVAHIRLVRLDEVPDKAGYLVKYMTKEKDAEWTVRIRASKGYGDAPTEETLGTLPAIEPPELADLIIEYDRAHTRVTTPETPDAGGFVAMAQRGTLTCANDSQGVPAGHKNIGTQGPEPLKPRRMPRGYFLGKTSELDRWIDTALLHPNELEGAMWERIIGENFPDIEFAVAVPDLAPRIEPPRGIEHRDILNRMIDDRASQLMASAAYTRVEAPGEPGSTWTPSGFHPPRTKSKPRWMRRREWRSAYHTP